MEGDAGASRLNPADTDDSSSEPHETEQTCTETTAEGLVETEPEDESEAEVDLDTETEPEDECEAEVDLDTETDAEDESEGGNAPIVGVNPSRLGRGWLIGITAALLVLAGGVGTGGYFALRANQESQAIARHDVEAVQAAKDCVVATQAPDVNAMTAGAQKIIDCSTGNFRAQAVLYSSLFVQAYQVANVHTQVSDMRAGAERNYDDGSVDVLVAFRVKVSNSQTQDREVGYRLRVKMAPAEGQYRIANIDQVAK
ncbi:Mce protein [Mycobacterium sp.]|uniref:Mce protein n=1 Tax=Mycobacterium sp. TaxID=1785 RepID=UPI003F9582E2